MQEPIKKNTAKSRRWARRFGLQALYQWSVSGQAISEIELQFLQDPNVDKVDLIYFKEILHGVPQQLNNIEIYLKRYIDRSLGEIDPVELAILRIAIFELLTRPDVPYRVVLNEALELGKAFGATDGYKFVNGILDKVAREVRHVEIAGKKSLDE